MQKVNDICCFEFLKSTRLTVVIYGWRNVHSFYIIITCAGEQKENCDTKMYETL